MLEVLSTVGSYAGLALMTVGCLLTLVAAIGVVRFPSLVQRQHAATKPQLIGFIFCCVGLALYMQTWAWTCAVFLAIILQTLTAPVGAHLVGRAARQSNEINDLTEPVYYRDFDQLPRPYNENLGTKEPKRRQSRQSEGVAVGQEEPGQKSTSGSKSE